MFLNLLKTSTSCISVVLMLSSCSEKFSAEEREIYNVTCTHEKLEQRQYNFDLHAHCCRFPEQLEEFILKYKSSEKVDVERARVLIVNTVEELLNLINSSPILRPKLANYPFTSENLTYSISFENINNNYYENPNAKYYPNEYISYVLLMKGCIGYAIFNPSEQKLQTYHIELYEEALKIVTENERSDN